MPKFRREPVATDRRFRPAGSPDYGTPERWQHSGRALELTEHAGILAARATEEHIVDFLLLRRMIAAPERDAALKFKLDYQRAALEARVTARYNPATGSRDFFAIIHERSDFEEAAYQRWRCALRAVGLRLSNIAITTMCHDIMPPESDLPLLQQALKKLTDWYGLSKERQMKTELE